MTITRRRLLAGTSALPLVAIRTRPAGAAAIVCKFANNLPPAHPLNLRATEAAGRIAAATGGEVQLRIFPSSQLGSDTDTLAQLRAGGVEFFTLSGLILATLVPAASINGIGFAFNSYDQVWPAMDGALGGFIREAIAARGLLAMTKIWDNGFRHITTSSHPVSVPDDLHGMKLRVPVSPLWTSLFQAFGAAPVSINFNEVYPALQTHLADGEENPLAVIDAARLYEVQKYCSLTGHMWDGFWCLANRRAFARLPADAQTIVARELDRAALDERGDVAALNASLRGKLTQSGMVFNEVDTAPFRDALRRAGFYAEWRRRYGDAAWTVLEGAVGTLS